MKRTLQKLWLALRSIRGQSLVEYALILVLVTVLLITALTTIGGKTKEGIVDVANTVGNSM